jgi:hypothetical protein
MAEAGRPTLYTEEIAKYICDRTSTSNASLKTICAELEIGVRTVLDWLHSKQEFSHMYAKAKELQADFLAEEIIEIADDSSQDLKGYDDFGNPLENKEFVNRSRLRVDARKWVASKLKPRKYGDKIEQEHTGNIKGGLSPEQFAQLLAAATANGNTPSSQG